MHAMSDDDTFVCVTPDTLHLSQYVAYVEDDSAGAVATFSGVTRNVFQGKKVIQLVFEAYDDMAGKIMRVSPALWFALQPRPYAGSWQKRIWTSSKATPVHYGHILMLKQCQRRSSASFPWHILESNILLALSSGSLPAGTQQMVFDKGGCCS